MAGLRLALAVAAMVAFAGCPGEGDDEDGGGGGGYAVPPEDGGDASLPSGASDDPAPADEAPAVRPRA